MLILTRRTGETVMIGDSVSATVLGVKGNQVRLGIDAPRNIEVHRLEVWERIQEEKQGQSPLSKKEQEAAQQLREAALQVRQAWYDRVTETMTKLGVLTPEKVREFCKLAGVVD